MSDENEGLKSHAILIVEDVPEMAEMIRGILEPEAKRVAVAKSRPEMLHELARRRPDVVLLDEIIPGEGLEGMMADVRPSGCIIVLMTSLSSRDQVPLPPGARARLRKPEWKSVAKFVTDLVKALR